MDSREALKYLENSLEIVTALASDNTEDLVEYFLGKQRGLEEAVAIIKKVVEQDNRDISGRV